MCAEDDDVTYTSCIDSVAHTCSDAVLPAIITDAPVYWRLCRRYLPQLSSTLFTEFVSDVTATHFADKLDPLCNETQWGQISKLQLGFVYFV